VGPQKELSVPVAIEEGENASLVRLEGDVSIAHAVEMKGLLLHALASGKEMRVTLENATELDITALQLLYAAERDAARSGCRFTLEGRVPDVISAAMTHAGCAKFQFQQ
jgi:anti-anti-sigma regulatory factor